MDSGNGNNARQMPWMLHGDMTAAWWANWCLLSLQMMHEFNRGMLTFAAGSYAGSLKATRSLWEQLSAGTQSPFNR